MGECVSEMGMPILNPSSATSHVSEQNYTESGATGIHWALDAHLCFQILQSKTIFLKDLRAFFGKCKL